MIKKSLIIKILTLPTVLIAVTANFRAEIPSSGTKVNETGNDAKQRYHSLKETKQNHEAMTLG